MAFASVKVVFSRLNKVLLKERKGLGDLEDEDVAVYTLLIEDELVMSRTGRFGFHSRPTSASAMFGHFASDVLDAGVLAAGLPTFDWSYWKSCGYWMQMRDLAMQREFRVGAEAAEGLTAVEMGIAVRAWGHLFGVAARMVGDMRTTFFRLAVDDGLVRARAASKEVEYLAKSETYASQSMREASDRFHVEYLKQNMKQEAQKQVAAELAAKDKAKGASGSN